jgi:DNA processing protein
MRTPDPQALARGDCTGSTRQPGHLLGWRDDAYPPLLRRIASPPAMLFVAGDPGLLWQPAVAVVGSRAATAGGCANAALFARALAQPGLCVASGLAAGIDAAAHHAALDATGSTVAVLGTGPDIAYPIQHRPLLDRLPPPGGRQRTCAGDRPAAPAFPQPQPDPGRDEPGHAGGGSRRRSGALITARLAAEMGREVFAIPGSIHNPMARGCHRLLREGAPTGGVAGRGAGRAGTLGGRPGPGPARATWSRVGRYRPTPSRARWTPRLRLPPVVAGDGP